MKTVLRILLLLLLSGSSSFARPLEVLFIGNSYTYVNNLPEVFRAVAGGAGHEEPQVSMFAVGGQSLAGFCRDPKLLQKLEARYDVVVLQEQSQIPAFAEFDPVARKQFLEACQWMCRQLRSRHQEVRIVLFQTWARHRSSYKRQPGEPAMGDTPEQMQARLTRWYAEAGRQCRAAVAPVGEAWLANYQRPHPLILHADDGSHPSFAGTYLAALVLARTIYGQDLATGYRGPLSTEDAQELQQLAAGYRAACR